MAKLIGVSWVYAIVTFIIESKSTHLPSSKKFLELILSVYRIPSRYEHLPDLERITVEQAASHLQLLHIVQNNGFG